MEQHPGINSPEDCCIIDFLEINYLSIGVRVELFDNFYSCHLIRL